MSEATFLAYNLHILFIAYCPFDYLVNGAIYGYLPMGILGLIMFIQEVIWPSLMSNMSTIIVEAITHIGCYFLYHHLEYL